MMADGSVRRHRTYSCLLPALILLAGCGPFNALPERTLAVTGTGTGDASGTWTNHFMIDRAPWRFAFHLDCSGAKAWTFDVTLEQMHANNYFEAVPMDLGWSSTTGKGARIDVTRTVQRSGEFWYIVRASDGCMWRINTPWR